MAKLILSRVQTNTSTHSFLDLVLNQVDRPVKEKSTPGSASESSRNELIPIRQHSFAVGTGKETGTADVIQEYTAHFYPDM